MAKSEGEVTRRTRGESHSFFQDLSQETLKRRRALKPLLAILCENQVQYNWGFPSCLIGRKNGCTARLRFIKDTVEFCRKLDIPTPKDL